MLFASGVVNSDSSGAGLFFQASRSVLFLESFRFSFNFWDGLFLSLAKDGSTRFSFELLNTMLFLVEAFGCGWDGVIRRFCFNRFP